MKKFIMLGMSALMVLGLAGCRSGAEQSKTSTSSQSQTSQSSKKMNATSSFSSSSQSATSASGSTSSTVASSTSDSSSTTTSAKTPAAATSTAKVAVSDQTTALNALIAQYGTNQGDTVYQFLGASTIDGQMAYNFDGFSQAAMQQGQRGQTGAFFVFADGHIVNTFENPNAIQ
ncbi:hypothetical protein [Furfurilactobacillus curtus]|uniref:Lipoprotein n=1 Tax=Furfurilactobacillus curtus TaxID=1746200 RepID=A0ABQ5JRQ6_9LACO